MDTITEEKMTNEVAAQEAAKNEQAVTYTLAQDDLLQFSLYCAKHEPELRKRIFLSQCFAPMLYMGVMLVIGYFQNRLVEGMLLGVAISVLWLIRSSRRTGVAMRRNVEALVKSGKADALLCEQTVKLTDGGIVWMQLGEETTLPYTAVREVVYDGALMYLTIATLAAVIIPETAFAGAEGKEAFKAAIKRRQAAVGENPAAAQE